MDAVAKGYVLPRVLSVDDQPAKLLRSYGMFRAVEIPAGSKDVKFWYDNPRYKTGRLITNVTGLWIIGVLAVCLALTLGQDLRVLPLPSVYLARWLGGDALFWATRDPLENFHLRWPPNGK